MRRSCVALIPARSGSKRLPDKNIKILGGHPLIAHAINGAIKSEIFTDVICSTDSEEYAAVARAYGAEVVALRPAEFAGSNSPDIEWVSWQLSQLQEMGRNYDAFSILRPTSPFRTAATIRRAWGIFEADRQADSLRALESCSQHPGKMWTIAGERASPLMPFEINGVPWHSNQSASLPDVFVQNACLEMAWSDVVFGQKSISGTAIIPFETRGYEGLDINNPLDFMLAELLLDRGYAELEAVPPP